MKLLHSGLLATFFVFASSAFSAGDAKKGEAIYKVCVSCHGVNGQGNKAMNGPRIGGQHDWYIIRQLKNFKNSIRGHKDDKVGIQMRAFAMTLDDKKIEDVAAYVSSLGWEK